MQATVLTSEQRDAFVRDGFVKVQGLIPPAVVKSTREALAYELDIDDHDPTTWVNKPETAGEAWKLTLPCWTPSIEAAGRDLVGPYIAQGPKVSPYLERVGAADPSFEGYIPVLRFPDGGDQAFGPPPAAYHIDGGASMWPSQLYLVVFVYLVDVKPYGGATVVLPGSHRQIFKHWLEQPDAAATQEFPDFSSKEPLPVAGRAGDVLLMHHLCAHSGSQNHDLHIRYGLNSYIEVDPEHPYRRRTGAPESDWTPLDYTLRTDTTDP